MTDFLFIADTTQYSGNFEREMCAFVTGQVGDCGVGHDKAVIFEKTVPSKWQKKMEAIVENEADEHGCFRPVKIYPTPGFFNDGMGNHWPDEKWGTSEVTIAYQEAINDYQQKYKDSLPHLDAKTVEVIKYPAFQSVAIILGRKPSKGEFDFLVKRTKEFFEEEFKNYPNDKLLSCRLVRVETVTTETEEKSIII